MPLRLFNQSYSLLIGDLSFIMSFLGLIIGFGGFWLTLVQLRRVKDSTQAATETLDRLKVTIAQFDTIQECAHAEKELMAIRAVLLEGKDELTHSLIEPLAITLTKIESGSPYLADSTRQQLSSLIGALDGLMSKAFNSRTLSNSAKQARTLRQFDALFVKIRAEIQQEQRI